MNAAALEAVMAAACLKWHEGHKRKFTGEDYSVHLAQCAGLVSLLPPQEVEHAIIRAVLWGHDCVEDVGVTYKQIRDKLRNFPTELVDQVILGISGLTDNEKGNRAVRSAKKILRLHEALGWVQSAKCIDIYSNGGSLAIHDPGFCLVAAPELFMILDAMGKADKTVKLMAKNAVKGMQAAALQHQFKILERKNAKNVHDDSSSAFDAGSFGVLPKSKS